MRRFLASVRHELGRIFGLRPVVSAMFVSLAIYAVIYPQPYLGEALRDVPVAVVDLDGSAASRAFVRALDATADAAVTVTAPDFRRAERAVFARAVHGVVLVPRDFERNLAGRRPAPVALYSDASYFLVHQRLAGAVRAVAGELGARLAEGGLRARGLDAGRAVAAAEPLPFVAIALFNPQGGYATYLLPAAFVLLVQQTLLIAVAFLGTIPDPAAPPRGALTVVAGRVAAVTLVEAAIIPAYLVVLPWLYGLPRLGEVTTMLLFAMPFAFAVTGAGMLIAELVRQPMMLQLALGTVGMVFFMLAGFAFPAEAMPAAVRWAALLVPSTSGIDGLVRITQTGASLPAVGHHYLALWALAAAYLGLAGLLLHRRLGAQPRVHRD